MRSITRLPVLIFLTVFVFVSYTFKSSAFSATLPATDDAAQAASTSSPTRSVEIAGFGGLMSGGGTNAALGGSVGFAANEKILVLGEFTYIPLGGGSVEFLGEHFGASARAFDINGGIHYQFALKNAKFRPYAAAGIGIVRSSGSVSGGGVSVGISNTDFAFNFGGGLRYQLSERWGIRPELKIFAGSGTSVRLVLGFFHR